MATLQRERGLSERRACAAVNLRRSVYRYRCRPNRDDELVEMLLQLAHQRPEEGFPKLFKRLRRQGRCWNHKRVHNDGFVLQITDRARRKTGITVEGVIKGQRRLNEIEEREPPIVAKIGTITRIFARLAGLFGVYGPYPWRSSS